MQDTALYQYLLSLKSPWTVSCVNLDVTEQRVDVWAEHAGDATWTCPHCAEPLPLYDHAEERTWRHLDSCQFQTYLHARIPRVACDEHGVVQILVPWAEPRSRFTLLFERLAIDVLRQCDVSGATRILRISWDEAWGLMERAVTRGRQRKVRTVVRRIGVDEKAAAKGHRWWRQKIRDTFPHGQPLIGVCDFLAHSVFSLASSSLLHTYGSAFSYTKIVPLAHCPRPLPDGRTDSRLRYAHSQQCATGPQEGTCGSFFGACMQAGDLPGNNSTRSGSTLGEGLI
ncbi:MAG: transposase family protein [Nitrospira sp.]|nr:transposase family protein [Nitrospiraceae bacterium]MBX3348846.1 transposase family protein [Nitrospira sp.]